MFLLIENIDEYQFVTNEPRPELQKNALQGLKKESLGEGKPGYQLLFKHMRVFFMVTIGEDMVKIW